MSRHNPIADPLSPYWRAKVEQASKLDPFGHLAANKTPVVGVLRSRGLTPRQRRYVALVEVQCLTPAEAARAEGVSRNNIYRALGAARAAREAGA